MRLLIVLSRGLKHQQLRRRTRRYARTRQTHRQTMRLLLPTRAGALVGIAATHTAIRKNKAYARTRQAHRQTMRLLVPTRAGAPLGGDEHEATRTAAHARQHTHGSTHPRPRHARPRTAARVSTRPCRPLTLPRREVKGIYRYLSIYISTSIHTSIYTRPCRPLTLPLPTADLAPTRYKKDMPIYIYIYEAHTVTRTAAHARQHTPTPAPTHAHAQARSQHAPADR